MKVIWFRRENHFYHLSFRKVHHTHFEEIVIDHFEEKNIVISNCISYLIPLKVSTKGCSVATMRRSLTWEMTKFSSRTPNTDHSVQRLKSYSASLSFRKRLINIRSCRRKLFVIFVPTDAGGFVLHFGHGGTSPHLFAIHGVLPKCKPYTVYCA